MIKELALIHGLIAVGQEILEDPEFQKFEREWDEAEAQGRLSEWLEEKLKERDNAES